MNLKERGITVGYLIIILIIILTTTVFIKTSNKDKKTTFNIDNKEEIFQNKPNYKKNYLNNFTLSNPTPNFYILRLRLNIKFYILLIFDYQLSLSIGNLVYKLFVNY